MNFDFMMECEIKDPKIKAAYDEIYKELVDAEAHYWKEPQQSGILFRKTAERICRFYNDYYEIGFPEGTLLEEFLCYTDKEEHNVLVSRFFSMVKDQRDRLNKLRVSVMTVSGEKRDRTAEWSFVTVWRRMRRRWQMP